MCVQDYYCDLSPIQQQLYEDFSKTHIHKHLSEIETDEKSHTPNKNNILQASHLAFKDIYL